MFAPLQHFGVGANPLAAAASQAIAATQQLTGRRTSRYAGEILLTGLQIAAKDGAFLPTKISVCFSETA
jgi:hypothetical protein